MLGRWDVAAEEALRREYTPGKLLSDMFGFWSDAASGLSLWSDLFTGDFPTVAFGKVAATTTGSIARSVPLFAFTSRVNVDATPLSLGSTKPQIDKVSAEVSLDGEALTVTISDLDKIRGLQKGEYEGRIHLKENDTLDVAFVTIEIV